MNRLKAQLLYRRLRHLFQSMSRVALLTVDHETLYIKYQFLADIGTLPQSAEVAHKYLNIQDGDIVLTNDPYSGGSLLSSPTLIMGVGTRQTKGLPPSAEFLIASRVALMPKAGQYRTIDEEGLRVPPSPYFIRGELNTPLVDALKAHPQARPEFMDLIASEAARLLAIRERMKRELASGELDLSRPSIKSYLQLTQKEFLRRLDELGEGSGNAHIEIGPEETLKLKVEHHDGHFTFDFNGTSAGKNVFLTDTATLGACIGATIALLNADIPINSGIFERFDLKTPRGSIVNSTFPRPVFLGHTDGVDLIANLVIRAFGLIHKKQSWATSGSSHCFYQLKFRNGSTLLDALPAGTGAREGRSGLSGIYLWWRLPYTDSVEELEVKYPIQILATGFRASSGGEGHSVGGQGAVRTIKMLDETELSWAHIAPAHLPEGLNGGKSALGPEMILQRATGETEELSTSGALVLHKGDTLTVLSPGGGGYGAKLN